MEPLSLWALLMGLLATLASTPPREKAGANSANAFDLQRHWSLIKLLDLHKSGADYVLLLDYHDDIVVLIRSEGGEQAFFYQIKSKGPSEYLTIKSLLHRPKGENGRLASVLGKLRQHELTFEGIAELSVVCNRPLGAKQRPASYGEEQDCCIGELSDAHKSNISEALNIEFPDEELFRSFSLYWIRFTSLTKKEHEAIAKSKLISFLDAHFPDRDCKDSVVFSTLEAEIKRRTQCTTDGPCSEEAILHSKAIDRNFFDDTVLRQVRCSARIESEIDRVLNKLDTEGLPVMQVERLRRIVIGKYRLDKTNFGNITHQTFRSLVRTKVERCFQDDFHSLRDLFSRVVQMVKNELSDGSLFYDENYILAAAVTEYAESGSISPFDPKFEEV